MIEAVVFDLDGILIDSEHVWDEVRQQLADERGGRWNENASRDMMGMSSIEWSGYMRDVVGLTEEPEEISAEVVRRLEDRYRRELPLIPAHRRSVARPPRPRAWRSRASARRGERHGRSAGRHPPGLRPGG